MLTFALQIGRPSLAIAADWQDKKITQIYVCGWAVQPALLMPDNSNKKGGSVQTISEARYCLTIGPVSTVDTGNMADRPKLSRKTCLEHCQWLMTLGLCRATGKSCSNCHGNVHLTLLSKIRAEMCQMSELPGRCTDIHGKGMHQAPTLIRPLLLSTAGGQSSAQVPLEKLLLKFFDCAAELMVQGSLLIPSSRCAHIPGWDGPATA